jgi:putative addiction module CopG family antidote
MNPVTVQLPQDLLDFIQREVASGRYDSDREVIEAALIQMKDRALRLQEIRRQFLEEDADSFLEIAT